MLWEAGEGTTEVLNIDDQFKVYLWQQLPYTAAPAKMAPTDSNAWTTTVPKMQKGMNWDHFKEEVRAWSLCAERSVEKKLMAVQVAINLPVNHPLRLRERVFDPGEYGVSKLNADTGVEDLIKFLDGIFLKDPLSNRYEIWKKVVGFRREQSTDVETCISQYEALFRKAEKNKIQYPDDIKGFMIMEGANLTMLQTQFVTNNCDFSCGEPARDAPRLYQEIKAGLKKVCGQQSTLLGGGQSGGGPALYTEEDLECFLAKEKGKNILKKSLSGKKPRKHSLSEGDKDSFKFSCWYATSKDTEKQTAQSSRKIQGREL